MRACAKLSACCFRGYPCIAAVALNTAQPALLYHRLISYATADFDSQPKEWLLTMRHLLQLLPGRKIAIVSDAEGDDRKAWWEAVALDLEWITRATSKRVIEVYRPFAVILIWVNTSCGVLTKPLPGSIMIMKRLPAIMPVLLPECMGIWGW